MIDKLEGVDVVDKLQVMEGLLLKDPLIKSEAISVSQLNKLSKTLLENNIPVFWIRGEISGLRTYSHLYFDLKDEAAKISCVLFAKELAQVDFSLENGQQIEVRGKVTIYPQNGSYQINISRVRKVGLGELWEAYHRLINKLKIEGLFEQKYKKPIPIFPRQIGVITSKEGAVIRDVVTTLKRRQPNIPIIVYHTAVQGQDAGMQIVNAIRTANNRCEVDVLIVCRGGGSMQDLWSFNEEVVAREVFASKIPIISAVGHETDTTIIDLVADLRAPTPTAAAELVATSKDEWLNLIHKLHYQLNNIFDSIINNKKQQLDLYFAKLRLLNPINQIKEKTNNLNAAKNRLDNAIGHLLYNLSMQLKLYNSKLSFKKINLVQYQAQIKNLDNRLKLSLLHNLQIKNKGLDNLIRHLELVNPASILLRGYAIVKNKSGKIVRLSSEVKHHERIEVALAQDSISAIVDKTYSANQGELI